jgi:hypothetical protein
MNCSKGLEGLTPMNHRPILLVADPGRFSTMGVGSGAASRPLNAPE